MYKQKRLHEKHKHKYKQILITNLRVKNNQKKLLHLLGIAGTNCIYPKCLLLSKLNSSISKHYFL